MHRYQCSLPGNSTVFHSSDECKTCNEDEICLRVQDQFECIEIGVKNEEECAKNLCPPGMGCSFKTVPHPIASCFSKQEHFPKESKEKKNLNRNKLPKGLLSKQVEHVKDKLEMIEEGQVITESTSSIPGLVTMNKDLQELAKKSNKLREKFIEQKPESDKVRQSRLKHHGASHLHADRVRGRRHRINQFNDNEELPIIADSVKKMETVTTKAPFRKNLPNLKSEQVKKEASKKSHFEIFHYHKNQDGNVQVINPVADRVKEAPVVIKEQDNPVKPEKQSINDPSLTLHQDSEQRRAAPQFQIDTKGQLRDRVKIARENLPAQEKEMKHVEPLLVIDSSGLPKEPKDKNKALGIKLGSAVTDNIMVGTLQAIRNRKEPILDNDLVNVIEQEQKFVQNRENQVVDPIIDEVGIGKFQDQNKKPDRTTTEPSVGEINSQETRQLHMRQLGTHFQVYKRNI